MDKSKGHVCYLYNDGSPVAELLHGPDGTLYKASLPAPLDLHGYRASARFECMPRDDNHAKHIRIVFGVEADGKEG